MAGCITASAATAQKTRPGELPDFVMSARVTEGSLTLKLSRSRLNAAGDDYKQPRTSSEPASLKHEIRTAIIQTGRRGRTLSGCWFQDLTG